jgi:hypothetical protein
MQSLGGGSGSGLGSLVLNRLREEYPDRMLLFISHTNNFKKTSLFHLRNDCWLQCVPFTSSI